MMLGVVPVWDKVLFFCCCCCCFFGGGGCLGERGCDGMMSLVGES